MIACILSYFHFFEEEFFLLPSLFRGWGLGGGLLKTGEIQCCHFPILQAVECLYLK